MLFKPIQDGMGLLGPLQDGEGRGGQKDPLS